jgi:dipeptidyl aminopeptidase/acylaminoacyl peptidase
VAYVQATLFTGQVNADYGGDVYLITPGGQPKLLWKHDQQGAQVQGMAWTPDGASLVIGYWLTIIKDNKFAGQVQRLSRIDVASGAMSTLFDGPMFPSFSRDGKTLAYMTQDLNGEGGLWVAGADGSSPRELVELGQKFNAILYPRISPDGSTLVFSAVSSAQSNDPGQTAGGLNALHGAPMDVWRVNIADGATQRITKLNEDEPYAAWTCDSKGLMIFATGGLYTLNADGSNLKKITDGAFGGHIDIKC